VIGAPLREIRAACAYDDFSHAPCRICRKASAAR
jgi:hypothetical protein